jgi:hypothetical protein
MILYWPQKGKLPAPSSPPAALVRRSFAQHAAAMFFPHFLADARTIGDVTYGASRPR